MQDMAQQTRDARDEKWPRCVGWKLGKLGGRAIDVTRQRAGAESDPPNRSSFKNGHHRNLTIEFRDLMNIGSVFWIDAFNAFYPIKACRESAFSLWTPQKRPLE